MGRGEGSGADETEEKDRRQEIRNHGFIYGCSSAANPARKERREEVSIRRCSNDDKSEFSHELEENTTVNNEIEFRYLSRCPLELFYAEKSEKMHC